jgi:glucose-6-phosphate isomerase
LALIDIAVKTTTRQQEITVTTLSRVSVNSDGFFQQTLGENGITNDQLEALSPRLDGLRQKIVQWNDPETVNFLNLPVTNNLSEIKKLGQEILQNFKRTVVFGIGGSSLGGEMLINTLGGGDHHNVTFYDNVDPNTLSALDRIPWKDTCLLVISKSGNTAETLSQFLTMLPNLNRALGKENVPKHTRFITENEEGALFELGQRLNIPVVPHPSVGGRFSVLSVVGLLPAYVGGVDVDAVVDGAHAMAQRCSEPGFLQNPAFYNGAAQYLHAEQGRTLSVHMPYADNLRMLINWFRQLWAESLGKIDSQGNHKGMTPVAAHGVTDQHSQLQLYLEGPDDKQITFFTSTGAQHLGHTVPSEFKDIAAIAPLAGHTTGELFTAEFQATRTTLTRKGRPNRTISLHERDAFAVGELIMLFEMETVVVAELMGIDPFDQPAVEESKVLTREYLSQFGSS